VVETGVTVSAPTFVPPLVKETVPVGIAPPVFTKPVRPTFWPNWEEFALGDNVSTVATGLTVKLCALPTAAASSVVADAAAVRLQVPVPTKLTVAPLTAQTAGVLDVTLSVGEPVPLYAKVGAKLWPNTTPLGIFEMLIVAAAALTAIDTVAVAAELLALPLYVAVPENEPGEAVAGSEIEVAPPARVVVDPPTIDGQVTVPVGLTPPLTVAVQVYVAPKVTGFGVHEAESAGVAGEIVIALATDVAAEKLALPAWLAVTVQAPAAVKVSVDPETEHAPLGAKDTARPELALADSPIAEAPNVTGDVGCVKVIVWDSESTVIALVTDVAAEKFAFPAWLAVTEQAPVAVKLRVDPETEQAPLAEKETASPEVALAESPIAADPRVTWDGGAVKVIVCEAGSTVIAWETEAAAV
jgi:hypothetical protein